MSISSRNISITLPNGQCPLETFWFITKKMSTTFKSLNVFVHFDRLFNSGPHSRNQRYQKCLTSSWTLKSVSSTDFGASCTPNCPWRKWFGVNGTLSFGLADWYVNGLELNNDSAPVNAVKSSSSVISAFPSIAYIARFADFIIVSWTPPKCGLAGGLKCHIIPWFHAESFILSFSSFVTSSRSSRSAPTKVVPLSDIISVGSPLRFTYDRMRLKTNQCLVRRQFQDARLLKSNK